MLLRMGFILGLLSLLSGCSEKLPLLQTFYELPEDSSCRIAVLPLSNQSLYPEGGKILYKILLSEIVATGLFSVVSEGDVLELYQQLRMYPGMKPTLEQRKIIGGRLNASIFIGGDILAMLEENDGAYLKTKMTLVLRLYDGQDGKMFWATYHRRQGEDYRQVLHFGRINTITTLARMMAGEIITLWKEKGMQPCPTS
jgi:polysaccharide biosynthesis protein PelC